MQLLAVADPTVGAVLLAAGVVVWRLRPMTRTGAIMVATGFFWFVGSVFGGAVFLHRGPLVHLHLSYPTGRLRRPVATVVVVVAYIVSFSTVLSGSSWLTLALALVIVAAALNGFTQTSGPARKAGGPALGSALAFAGLLALSSANRLLGWEADRAVLLTYDAVVVLVALVLTADLLWGGWTDAALADLVTGLGQDACTDGLRGQLGRALGDPSLVVGIWTPEQGRYVDDAGRPLELPAEDGRRAVTRIDEHGEPLAALIHDTVVVADARLVAGVASAARLVVANARMQAAVRQRSKELAASRRRIVEASDAQSRQLQAELKGGAELRLGRVDRLLDHLQAHAVGAVTEELRDIRAELSSACDELRKFAQDIRPSALDAGGLPFAVPVLAARAPVPVTLAIDVGRLPPPIEAATFFLCSEALVNVSKHAKATRAVVKLLVDGGYLVATVVDDGVGGADPRGSGLRGLTDRVEALGGTLLIIEATGGGTRLTARIPTEPADDPQEERR